MPLGKGFDELARRQAESGAAANRKYRDVFLSNAGSTVKFRFLTEGTDVVVCDVHTVWTKTRNGKNRPTRIICTSDEPQGCAECQSDDEDRRRRSTQTFSWVYVYEYLFPTKPQRGESEVVMVRGKTMFLQKANVVGLYAAGWAPGQQLANFFAEYGTLCDRDYKLSREATAGGKTNYILYPTDPKVVNIELDEDLPDLIEHLLKGEEENKPSTSSGAVSYDGDVAPGDAKDYDF